MTATEEGAAPGATLEERFGLALDGSVRGIMWEFNDLLEGLTGDERAALARRLSAMLSSTMVESVNVATRRRREGSRPSRRCKSDRA